jgi:hypothetical protein
LPFLVCKLSDFKLTIYKNLGIVYGHRSLGESFGYEEGVIKRPAALAVCPYLVEGDEILGNKGCVACDYIVVAVLALYGIDDGEWDEF